MRKHKGKIRRLVHQLFAPRHKDYIPIYLSRFDTIEKMMQGGLLAIDLEKRYVCIDASLHIQYMGSDKEYAAFFNNIRAYMNFRLGMLQRPMINPEDRIDFGVMLKQTVCFDGDTLEVYDPPKETYHILLVGINVAGSVEYRSYREAGDSTEDILSS